MASTVPLSRIVRTKSRRLTVTDPCLAVWPGSWRSALAAATSAPDRPASETAAAAPASVSKTGAANLRHVPGPGMVIRVIRRIRKGLGWSYLTPDRRKGSCPGSGLSKWIERHAEIRVQVTFIPLPFESLARSGDDDA